MPLIKACLFDLDGVIVDTARFHYIAWRQLANDLGFDLTEQENEQLKGISRMESLEIILGIGGVELSEDEKLSRAAEKNTRYLALCQQMTPDDTLPGVRAFLDELKVASMGIGLGSASKNAKIILERIDMLSYFQTIVDGNRITKGKPDPQVFLMGADDLDTLPENCVVFEDAVAGIQSAKSAGMFAVGIGEKSVLAEADFVVPGFNDFHLADLVAASESTVQ
ncbi:beta-phosphoglucomutase [Dyadobacter psychrotolerans]|uniref:Beta-phosphoglucomutase n=1 Tax=Dyadobacter psychrotolerans TaxID=2541721 RepID=A0A4R5DQJ2_9BACT|nr:beta-phosphoglucomutase [Dyadobacter psychrotolerans]TDE16539.1 beta-phosphoglucomutase [Dyadobacter psychrotolerans]